MKRNGLSVLLLHMMQRLLRLRKTGKITFKTPFSTLKFLFLMINHGAEVLSKDLLINIENNNIKLSYKKLMKLRLS